MKPLRRCRVLAAILARSSNANRHLSLSSLPSRFDLSLCSEMSFGKRPRRFVSRVSMGPHHCCLVQCQQSMPGIFVDLEASTSACTPIPAEGWMVHGVHPARATARVCASRTRSSLAARRTAPGWFACCGEPRRRLSRRRCARPTGIASATHGSIFRRRKRRRARRAPCRREPERTNQNLLCGIWSSTIPP